ncbi:MAG: immunoglobulin domain-containing protein [Paludibacteraceae bacterium]|nr:immunoglobulin domain-containing protein [Paludibacteraceae bacterium]
MRKILLTLLTSLLCSVTVWGTDFSATEITSSGTSKGNITCKSTAGTSSSNSCTDAGGSYASGVTVSRITTGGPANYIEIQAASGYKLQSPITVTGIVDNNANKNIVICCWTGDYDNTGGFSSYEVKSWPNRKTACANTAVSISFTGTIRTIRLYKQVYLNSTTKLLSTSSGSGFSQLGSGTNLNVSQISATAVSAGGGCSAPTSPSISGTAAYTAGNDISLTASATGTSASTTYTWYKGANWATASASSPVQAASTSGAFSKASCSMSDAGTYWCNISNGTGCDVQVSKAITVSCKNPTQTFSNSDYTVGGAALNLASKFSSNSSGAVTYSVQNAGGTGASIAGTSFSATTEGTATVRASQAANGDYCAKTIDASVSVTADDCTDPGLTITLN